jgi:hypothetical protein
MTNHAWVEEFPGAITVCDAEGIILEMNARSAESNQEDGGKKQSAAICCPAIEPARIKLEKMMETRQASDVYHRKEGVKSWFTKRLVPGRKHTWVLSSWSSRSLPDAAFVRGAAEAWHKVK